MTDFTLHLGTDIVRIEANTLEARTLVERLPLMKINDAYPMPYSGIETFCDAARRHKLTYASNGGIQKVTQKFIVGETYATRAITDHDTIFSFEILSRTEKTITTKVHGKTVRRGVYIYEGVERFKPFGTYSMCAIIGADEHARKLAQQA